MTGYHTRRENENKKGGKEKEKYKKVF